MAGTWAVPPLLGPFFLVHYLRMVRVFRAMREGRGVIASWSVPAREFARFCEREQAIPARSILVNYYKPPAATPAEGVEVVFSDRGVLIGGGYFPLSVRGGRRVQSVEHVAGDPPAIQFGMGLHTSARTSSATVEGQHRLLLLRVPVALSARGQASEVADRFRALMNRA
ncbi:MAG TPA: hypothetical protein VNQ32_05635 [Steroidobacteraceae bacterium]|nr:hypothetical protein [Steroidobacteraceae bacterium]